MDIDKLLKWFPSSFLMKIPRNFVSKVGLEDLLQIRVMWYIKENYPNANAFSVKNESNQRRITPIALWKFKQMGLTSGVSDVLILEPNSEYHGMIIELKSPDRFTVSDNQKMFLDKASKSGYYTLLSNDFDTIQTTIDFYLNNK